MNCGEAREIIQLYLDSELDARSTLSVLRHIEICAACSQILARDLEQDARLKQAACSELVDSQRVRKEIVSAIRRQVAGSTYRWPLWRLWRYASVFASANAGSIYRKS